MWWIYSSIPQILRYSLGLEGCTDNGFTILDGILITIRIKQYVSQYFDTLIIYDSNFPAKFFLVLDFTNFSRERKSEMKSFLLHNLSLTKVTTLKHKNDRDVLKDYWLREPKLLVCQDLTFAIMHNLYNICTKSICLPSYII